MHAAVYNELVYVRMRLREVRVQRNILEAWENSVPHSQDVARRVVQINEVVMVWKNRIDELRDICDRLQEHLIDCCFLLVLI